MGNKSRKKSILVIDDDERVLIAMECLLEAEGYETATAWSGHEALELLRLQKFDLVVVDDYLWDMDVEVILKTLQQMAVPPRVMLTENAPASGALNRYQGFGASAVVNKWASCDEITRSVRECLAERPSQEVLV